MAIRLQKCCCLTSVRKGTDVIGIILMLRAATYLTFGSVMLANLDAWKPREDPMIQDDLTVSFVRALIPLLILWITVNVTEIAANLILRWSPDIPIRHRKNVREWLRNMRYLGILYVIVLPAIAYTCLHGGFMGAFFAIVVLGTLQLVVNLYCYLVVRSHYLNIMEEEGLS